MIFAYDMIWRSPKGCSGLSLTQQLDATGHALLQSPYFRAKGGHDHLIVSDSYKLSWMDKELNASPSFLLVHRPPIPRVCKPLRKQGACPQQRLSQLCMNFALTSTSQQPLKYSAAVRCNLSGHEIIVWGAGADKHVSGPL